MGQSSIPHFWVSAIVSSHDSSNRRCHGTCQILYSVFCERMRCFRDDRKRENVEHTALNSPRLLPNFGKVMDISFRMSEHDRPSRVRRSIVLIVDELYTTCQGIRNRLLSQSGSASVVNFICAKGRPTGHSLECGTPPSVADNQCGSTGH